MIDIYQIMILIEYIIRELRKVKIEKKMVWVMKVLLVKKVENGSARN